MRDEASEAAASGLDPAASKRRHRVAGGHHELHHDDAAILTVPVLIEILAEVGVVLPEERDVRWAGIVSLPWRAKGVPGQDRLAKVPLDEGTVFGKVGIRRVRVPRLVERRGLPSIYQQS